MAPSACSAGRLLIRSTYYYGFNIEDCVFCRPPRVEKFTLSPDNVWYCRLKLLFSPLVLDHLMLLKAGLRAAPREGNSARCPCLICIWKAPCGPGRRHRDHPVQIQRWSTQWSSSLRPQPDTRWCTLWTRGIWAGPGICEWRTACHPIFFNIFDTKLILFSTCLNGLKYNY